MLTRTTVPEFAEQGIRVNAICPGPTRTEMTDNLSPELIPLVVTSTPIGRFADASELASSALLYSLPATCPLMLSIPIWRWMAALPRSGRYRPVAQGRPRRRHLFRAL
ncbi:MAG: SDR family oxidoreductase [Novosphingobium sp.]